MKILVLSNQSRSMSIFWKILILALLGRGNEVICCVPPGDDESDARLRSFGASVTHYDLQRKGLNPLADAASYRQLINIMGELKPDILFATTIKPVIYGCMAAAKTGVKGIFATITGLGYAFEADTIFKKAINYISRFLYKTSLANATGIFFQNKDDYRLFLDQGILGKDAPVSFARGTGVDINHFAYTPVQGAQKGQPIKFLFVGRLLEAKGLKDFAQAARHLSERYPNARFQILGPEESGPGSLPLSLIKSWRPYITYLGKVDDVRPHLQNSHVIVLPSWREGVPTSLMEAMSIGRACVATDVPGCREVIKDGGNGYLVAAHDAVALSAAMQKFLDNPSLITAMGNAGRSMAEKEFNADNVANGIIRDMGL